MANASDVVIYAGLGALAAYVTNFMGFKVWADTHIIQQPPPPPVSDPVPPGGDPQPEPPVKNDPPPKPGNTFNCVSYPRCNTVSGTDARKRCCCTNKCSLMKKSNQTMNPTMSGNMCYCNFKTIAPKPLNCTGPCPLGKRPAVVSGRCGCVNCTNTCTACYDRISNCGCKFNASKIIHKDTNCSIGCNGYACWTNYPCINRGARAQKCVKSANCTTARAAWLAAYGCKSSFAEAYHSTMPHEAMDEGLMQVPTIA